MPLKVKLIILTLPLIVGFSGAFEKQTFKSQWSQQVMFPFEVDIVESSNNPATFLVIEAKSDLALVNMTVQSFANGRRTHACDVPTLNRSTWLSEYQLKSLDNDLDVLTFNLYADDFVTTMIIIVDMKTCETDVQKVLTTRDATRHVAFYKDSVDLFLTNMNLCNNHLCKWKYNVTSKMWSGPSLFPAFASFNRGQLVGPIHVANSTTYVCVIVSGHQQTLALVDSANDKLLNWVDFSIKQGYVMPHYSAENEAIGVCYNSAEKKINCTQMDFQLKRRFSVELEFQHKVLFMQMYNLKDGEMLLLMAYCLKEGESSCKEYEIDLYSIYADGRYEGPKEVAQVDCHPYQYFFKFISESGDICIKYICYSDLHHAPYVRADVKVFQTFVKCF